MPNKYFTLEQRNELLILFRTKIKKKKIDNPYHFLERGCDENANGLLRQFTY